MDNEHIYERYAENIMRFFSNKAASPNDIDDLMHTTFVRYIERSEREEIHQPLRFLYVIARNVLLEYWRKRKRFNLHDDVGGLSLADMGAGITTLIAQDESKQQVLDALRTLRLDFQTAVEMFYWEKLPYEEIAKVLETNPATIGTWLSRSRRQLKKRLAELYPDRGVAGERSTSKDEPVAFGRADEEPPDEEDDSEDSHVIQGLMDGVRDIASGRDDDDDDV